MNKHWIKEHSLAPIVALMYIASHLGMLWTFRREWVDEQQSHLESTAWADFWWAFWARTFENWQSEAWQVFWMVVLTVWFVQRGSAESRDSQDRMEAKLDEILRRTEA